MKDSEKGSSEILQNWIPIKVGPTKDLKQLIKNYV